MNIAIYDLQHYEMVNVLLNILPDESNFLLLSNKRIIDKIEKSTTNKKVKYINVKTFENIDIFFENCSTIIQNENIDFIIFNTIDSYYKSIWKNFIKKIEIPIVVTIHNINTWLRPPFTLNKNALSNYYYRKKIIKKTSAIIIQEELFIDYIKEHNLYRKPIFVVPHTLCENNIDTFENDKLTIAIPGAIDGHRRDYNLCFNVIEKIHHQTNSNNIRYKFLGEIIGPIGEILYNKMKKIQNKNIDIIHLFSPESNALFDSEMSKCDIVFLPLNVKTKYEGITEIYGLTKVTGVLYDMMRFQKPGIIPDEMIIPPNISSSIIKYKSEDELISIILNLVNDKNTLKHLQQNAKSNSDYYTKEKIRERFLKKFLNTILN